MLIWSHRLIYCPITCSNPSVPFIYRYTLYTYPLPVAGATTTKLNLTSTISSPSTSFHRCKRGIFGFWLHLAQLWTVTSFFQCYQSPWETLFITHQCQLVRPTTPGIPGIIVILLQPVWVTAGCGSRGARAVLQPSSCKHVLAQVVHPHPWGQIPHQDVPPPLQCHLSRTPGCTYTVHRPAKPFVTLMENKQPLGQAL